MIAISFTSCTREVPDYVEDESGESTQWVDIFGDTTRDMGVYVHYENEKIVAAITSYSIPDSIGYIQDISVSIKEYTEQDSTLTFCYGEFPGTTKSCLESPNYTKVARVVTLECDTFSVDEIHFVTTRTYSVNEKDLPETLELNYDVKTTRGNASGTLIFRKVIYEREEVMRIH